MPVPDQSTLVLSFNLRIGLIISREIRDLSPVQQGFSRVMNRLDQILRATPHTCSFITGASRSHELAVLDDYVTTHGPSGISLLKVYTIQPATDTEESLRQSFSTPPSVPLEVVTAGGATPELPLTAVEEAVIRDCDLLIIASREGAETDEEARYLLRIARMVGRSLFAINGKNGAVLELRNNDRFLDTLENLNTFNRERLSVPVYEQAVGRYTHIILRKLIKSGLPPDIVRPLCRTMLPQFARANQLAKQYHRRYLMAGNIVYGFSVLAVLAVTLQVVFFPSASQLIWVEAITIAVILAFLIGSKTGEWHRKWVDYRFLAERLRTAFFLCVTCVRCRSPDPHPYQALAHRPNDWMVIAFEQIVEARPTEHCRLDLPFHALRSFLLDAWIDNRLSYYSEESERNSRLYQTTAHLGEALFFITFVVAIAHAAGMDHQPGFPLPGNFLAVLTIVLPVAGAAFAAIRVQREYLKNSERHAHVVRHLSALRNQIRAAQSTRDLCNLLEEMNELTMREQQDWRIIFRFRDIEA